MATALHEAGVNTVVSASDNGLLIRVHNRFVPRLLELLAGTTPQAPTAETPTAAPVHPEGERPPHVWLNGSCIAMLSDLPDGTWFNYDADDPTSVDEADEHWRTMSVHPEPVIVVAWADGTTPQAPTVDSVPEADDVLLSLADDVAEVTEARRIYGRNFR